MNSEIEIMTRIIKNKIRALSNLERIYNNDYTIITNYHEVKNPVERYPLFIAMILSRLDDLSNSLISDPFFFGQDEFANHHHSIKEYPEVIVKQEYVKEKILINMKLLKEELVKISDWIQKDKLSPDEPDGKALMELAKKDYNIRK